MDLSFLPAVNASLNALSTVFLLLALKFIKEKKVDQHRLMMMSAFVISVIFLACYLAHKYFLWATTGSFNKSFGGEGIWRLVYFILLIPHVTLAIPVPVMAIIAIRRGLTNQVDKHKSLVRWAFPIWLYVSITGVLVYFMLYQWFPAAPVPVL